MQPQCACLSSGEYAQIVEQSGHHPRLFQRRFEIRPLRRVEAIQDSFNIALNYGKGSAELVGDIRKEVPPLFLARPQSFDHSVERANEAPHLTRATFFQ